MSNPKENQAVTDTPATGVPVGGNSARRSLKHRLVRSTLDKCLNKFGWSYQLFNGLAYSTVLPVATYSPWNLDADFVDTFSRIREHTMVDLYRCWELWDLVGQLAKHEGAIIEIGVWRGGTGALLAKRAALSGIVDPVYLCDTFRGVVKAGQHDTVYKGGEHADTSVPTVQELLSALSVTTARILKGIFPEETGHLIPPETRFRLIHVDVDVYSSAKDIMEWIWDRLVIGGVVVYDDYGFVGCEGIVKHVREQAARTDRVILHNLNGHAVVVKTR